MIFNALVNYFIVENSSSETIEQIVKLNKFHKGLILSNGTLLVTNSKKEHHAAIIIRHPELGIDIHSDDLDDILPSKKIIRIQLLDKIWVAETFHNQRLTQSQINTLELIGIYTERSVEWCPFRERHQWIYLVPKI